MAHRRPISSNGSSSRLLEDTINQVDLVLSKVESLAKRSKKEFSKNGGFTSNEVSKFQDDLLKKGTGLCTLKQKYLTLKDNAAHVLNNIVINENDTPQELHGRYVNLVQENIAQKTASYDAKLNPVLARIVDLIEDAFEIQEEEESELTYRCPVTTLKMERPMKSTACPHRVCNKGLPLLFKTSSNIHCPVPGCSKVWNKSTVAYDEEFDKKMQAFFSSLNKASKSQGKSQKSQAATGEDDGYTNV